MTFCMSDPIVMPETKRNIIERVFVSYVICHKVFVFVARILYGQWWLGKQFSKVKSHHTFTGLINYVIASKSSII